jgi:hypothetical protein
MDSPELERWVGASSSRLSRDDVEAFLSQYRAAAQRYAAAFDAYSELVKLQAQQIIHGDTFSSDELMRTRVARAALEVTRCDLRHALPRLSSGSSAARLALSRESPDKKTR